MSDTSTSEGKPELVAAICAEINAGGGEISFERFMALALYHPQYGYYAAAKELPTGRTGDFFTNVSVGPLYGEFVGRKMAAVWEELGKPERFTLAEQGAMDGQLAADIFSWAKRERVDFFSVLDYRLVDPFPENRSKQKAKLSELGVDRVSWLADWNEMGEYSLVGAIFSNELVDSFPVHRIVRQSGQWLESFVTLREKDEAGKTPWQFVNRPIAGETLRGEVARLPLPEIEGYTTEVNLRARAWMRAAASRLKRGVMLTVDYGFPSEVYYRRERMEGTLQCYRAHRSNNDPLRAVGAQDMTAHVNFSALIEEGEAAGLRTLQFIDQYHFILDMITAGEAVGRQYSPKEVRMLKTLMHPEMMGTRFRYLIQGRDVF